MLNQIPERSPLMPSRFPALLMSWQGNPAVIVSTSPRRASQGAYRTSPMFGASGKRYAMTSQAALWTSATTVTLSPVSCSTAIPSPPYPAHNSKIANVSPLVGAS